MVGGSDRCCVITICCIDSLCCIGVTCWFTCLRFMEVHEHVNIVHATILYIDHGGPLWSMVGGSDRFPFISPTNFESLCP